MSTDTAFFSLHGIIMKSAMNARQTPGNVFNVTSDDKHLDIYAW